MRLSRDPLTRWWWRIVGRPVDLDGEHAWLDAPTSRTSHVDDQAWIADWAERIGGTAVRGGSDAGLIPAMEALDGPGLDVSRLAAPVRDFYEHTSRWHMDVWAEWSPLFWPAGELVSRLFAKRIQQLALPMRALDVAHGMDSSVTVIRDASGAQASAGWIRRLRSTGDPVFSGPTARTGCRRPTGRACTSPSRWRAETCRSICARGSTETLTVAGLAPWRLR